jgi:nucleolar protein 58
LLKKEIADGAQEQLLVSDAKLGNAIKDKLELSVLSNNNVNELMRCIRLQTESLISGLSKKDITAMELGLAHR